MSAGEDEIDPEILMVFVEEALESIEGLDAQFVTLEQHPGDGESLAAIFRVMHTVKGNSAFFGLMKVKKLAHHMEDLMALMREGRVDVTPAAIQTLLRGLDELRSMLHAVQNGEGELSRSSQAVQDELLSKLRDLCEAVEGGGHTLAGVLSQIDRILAGPADIQQMRERLKLVRTDVAELYAREAGTSKAPPNAAGSATVPTEAPEVELARLLAQPFEEQMSAPDAERVRELLVALQAAGHGGDATVWQRLLAEYDAAVPDLGLGHFLVEGIQLSLRDARRAPLADGPERTPPVPGSAPDQGKPMGAGGGKRDTPARTMRVEENKIDQFLDYVGELIIVREMFANVGKLLRENSEVSRLSADYQRALEAFTLLSHSLQGSIMEVRKVPVKAALQKVPRLARDLSAARGKEVKVVLSGDGVPIDKSLLEALEGPLTHMVRNAVDHGIEAPEERERAGKPRTGTLRVEAFEEPDYVRIEIADDGGGIHVDRLKAKAIESGILTASQADRMSDTDARNLLFAPGLSTAKEVTDISGRGVGMDVVRRNVTDLGGEIRIDSELGVGTTFNLLLPKAVTVQILDGFLVRVCNHRFVLPLTTIKESFRPDRDQIVQVAERGEFISRRGQVFPLVRFGELLRIDSERACASDRIVVSVDLGTDMAAGLLVDEVLGVQQVVLREVNGIEDQETPFAGGAVLGDGRVAMVVDVDRLGGLM